MPSQGGGAPSPKRKTNKYKLVASLANSKTFSQKSTHVIIDTTQVIQFKILRLNANFLEEPSKREPQKNSKIQVWLCH